MTADNGPRIVVQDTRLFLIYLRCLCCDQKDSIKGGRSKPRFICSQFCAGMAALRTGAELVYVFTAEEAALPIKSYSPELMVTPVYSLNLKPAGCR